MKPLSSNINGAKYVFHPLDYDEALLVSTEIAVAVLPGLGAMVDGPLGAAMRGDLSLEDLMDLDLNLILEGMDFNAVGSAMAGAIKGGALSPSLIRRALASTVRDGETLIGDRFDCAFKGRLLESLVAAFHAVRANGLFESPSISNG